MSLDLSRLRQETPSCEQLLHFNNAGCALSPRRVTEAVDQHLAAEQRLGGYEAADAATDQLEEFYSELALLLNCQENEVAFIENATRAWDIAVHSIPWRTGDEILIGQNEYVSNYLGLLSLQKRYGIEPHVIPCNPDGLVDPVTLSQAVSTRTKAIFLTHVASQCGDIQDAAAIGTIAQENGLWYVLDACQSVGQLRVKIEELGCDFLCGTGRKYLRGPRGTGFLYARRSKLTLTEPVFVDLQAAQWTETNQYRLRDDARRFETWERNTAGQIGLATALRYCNELGIDNIEQRVRDLAQLLRTKLNGSNCCRTYEVQDRASGIVTFRHDKVAPSVLQSLLRQQGINTSLCREKNAKLDLEPAGTGDLNRASLHYYNSEEEVARFVDVLTRL